MLWAFLGLMIVAFVLYEAYRNPRLQLFGDAVHRVETDQKVVALTFDDGPKPDEEMVQEIEDTTKLIRKYGYTKDLTFRPPFGKSLFKLPNYLKKKGMPLVTWDVEAATFIDEEDTTEKIVDRTLKQVKPGSIIIFQVLHCYAL